MRINRQNIFNKLSILSDVLMGNVVKARVLFDVYVRRSVRVSADVDPTVVVSLTSYGDRVGKCVAYTAYSLLRQSVRPSSVVLWLSEDHFNDGNLPRALRFLCAYGLDIRYCRDIRSYTKIVHSLKAFPDKHIITADDDLYYTSDFVKEFVEAHRAHPQSIITAWARIPRVNGDGQLAPYGEWPEVKHASAGFHYDGRRLLPLGVGGVLYPAHVFDGEALNESVFLSLCPKADDIWLYVMGLRLGVDKRLLVDSHISYYQTDTLRQYLTSDRLTESNRFGGENDTQLRALLDYYKIPVDRC